MPSHFVQRWINVEWGQRWSKRWKERLRSFAQSLCRSGPSLGKSILSASGVAVWREVCGNKLLMCFLFVAARSYQDAWHKLFGRFRNIAKFHSPHAIKFSLSLLLMVNVAFILNSKTLAWPYVCLYVSISISSYASVTFVLSSCNLRVWNHARPEFVVWKLKVLHADKLYVSLNTSNLDLFQI